MKHQAIVLTLCAAGILSGAAGVRDVVAAPQAVSDQAHVAWVGESLEQMRTIKPGMSREQLLAVFTMEGGISTRLHRTYVYRRCPLFKVDVEFEPVGRPTRDTDGRITPNESPADIIKVISKPYLAGPIRD